jgi:tetraacyldisaccharide 4'-kinase
VGAYHIRYGGLLERVFRLIQDEEQRSARLTVLRLLATCCASVYGVVVQLRNRLFDAGLRSSKRVDCCVISVGNLTVGGTGKTPMVLWLARFLLQEGRRVAVVSRGYGGESKGRVRIVSDGRSILAGSRLSGDEPHLLAARLPAVPVLCSDRRPAAVQVALQRFQSQVVILDDGFQHRFLARDLDVVLLDARRPLGNGHLLPRGILREPEASLKRADALVLSRFDGSTRSRETHRALARRWPEKAIFRARHRPARLFDAATGREEPLSYLAGVRVGAFAGIGRPDDFFHCLSELGGMVVYASALPDHHPLTAALLESLASEAARLEPHLWLTTEKDWVRLPEILPERMDLWVLAIELDLESEEARFKEVVRGVLERSKE